jgi:hypothetical protein
MSAFVIGELDHRIDRRLRIFHFDQDLPQFVVANHLRQTVGAQKIDVVGTRTTHDQIDLDARSRPDCAMEPVRERSALEAQRRHRVVRRDLIELAISQAITTAIAYVPQVKALLVEHETSSDNRGSHAFEHRIGLRFFVNRLVRRLNRARHFRATTRNVVVRRPLELLIRERLLDELDRERAGDFAACRSSSRKNLAASVLV